MVSYNTEHVQTYSNRSNKEMITQVMKIVKKHIPPRNENNN